MKAKKKFKLALLGTDSLRGKEIKTVFGQKKFPAFDLEFFDPDVEEEFSKLTEFKKEPKVIHGIQGDALASMDLVFLAADRETSLTYGERALKGEFKAIDLSEAFNDRKDVPLLVAGVNDGAYKPAKTPLVANPHPAAIMLSHLFHALAPAFGLIKAVSFVLEPVSAFEDPGIQELASQSVALLNSNTPKKKVFKEQIAYNLLSHTGPTDDHGFCPDELRTAAEVRRILDRPDLPLSMSFIQAPVFHTYSIMTYLELDRAADIDELETLFGEAKAFKVNPFREGCTISSVTASGSDEIHVGQIKTEASNPRAAWVWLVADNLTRGSAINAFELARKILPGRAG
jgi:aspartate-semialdehyde dehydrogenase